jgi:hypothetical protein
LAIATDVADAGLKGTLSLPVWMTAPLPLLFIAMSALALASFFMTAALFIALLLFPEVGSFRMGTFLILGMGNCKNRAI